VSRSYLYQIARRKSAFFKPYVWWVKERLDVDRMRVAAAAFVGMKDFASFTADEPDEKSTRVLIDRLDIAEDGALLLVRIQGSHFLWRMVRRLVGVLTAVGRGEMTPADAAGFLDERSDAPAALTAPGSGLFLEGVYYRTDEGPGPLRGILQLPDRR
jgi:tRNA pseudouridine38-40 synthase